MQIGDNTNLWDWTFVGNVVKGHLLAAVKLVQESAYSVQTSDSQPSDKVPTREQLTDYALPTASLTSGEHRVPTSSSRPLGPVVYPPVDGATIEERWKEGGKMAYWLFRKVVASQENVDGLRFGKKVVLREGKRNNFCILL